MQQFSQWLEEQFEYAHQKLMVLSEHWKAHTNRRTVFIVVVVGVLMAVLYIYAIEPPDTFPAGQLVSVGQGESVDQIALDLQKDGVIRSPLMFRFFILLTGKARQLRAGDYLFKEPKSVFAVAHAISIGAYGLEPFRIRIPEGATTQQMADIYDKVLPRFSATQFLSEAKPQEGYLFPDTYFFLPNATADTVMQAMRQDFNSQIATIQPQIASSTHSLSELVIMASIIEREAPDMQDRRMIAGVLWRRLKLGMALQTDVTFLYVIPQGAPITATVLQMDSPYNTYLHTGLPPTPIGSPSLDSLIAAATPIDKGYLFYLADSSGVTHYSKTYAGQLANERKYLGK